MSIHDGHRKRLKDRFLQFGLDSFTEIQVLELLLFYAVPRQDTNIIAHRLLKRFGRLSRVLDAPVEQLTEVDGIGEHAATLLKLANADGILESHREFYHWMVNDLEALDHHLLRQNPELSRLFIRLMDGSVTCSLPGYIEKEYIESSLHWWKHQYLPAIENRTLLHITETDIDEFIALASKEIASELKQLL